MAGDFSTLYRLQGDQYVAGCPVVVRAGALLMHEPSKQLIGQLKLESFSAQSITAVVVRLMLHDVLGQTVGTLEYQYLDLMVAPHQTFGEQSAIVLDRADVRSFDVMVSHVALADGSIWSNGNGDKGAVLPSAQPLNLPEELLGQYRRTLNEPRLTGVVQPFSDLWQCGCGCWNMAQEKQCFLCHCSRTSQEEYAHADKLQPLLNAYQAEQQQRERVSRAARRQEAERAEAAKARQEEALRIAQEDQARRKKRLRRNAILIGAAAVALVAVIMVFSKVIIPRNQYNYGMQAYNEGRYAEACDAFAAAGDYNGAHSMYRRSATALGDQYMDNMQYRYAAQAYGDADSSSAEIAKGFHQASAANWLDNSPYIDDKTIDLPQNVYAYPAGNKTYNLIGIGEKRWAANDGYTDVRVLDDGKLLVLKKSSDYAPYTLVNTESGTVRSLWRISAVYGGDCDALLVKNSDDLYGWVNSYGSTVIECQYTNAYSFSEGLAAVEKDGLWGYIDETGETVIDFQYPKASSMSGGYARVYLDKRYVKVNDLYQEVPAGYGVIDAQGNICIEPQWDDVVFDGYVHEGVVKVVVKTGSSYGDRLYGLMGLDGTVRLEPVWTVMGKFSEGLLCVHKLTKNHYPCDRAGYVDASGSMVINLVAMGIDGARDSCDEFENGLARITAWIDKGGRLSRDILDNVIDRDGNLLLDWQVRSMYWVTDDVFKWSTYNDSSVTYYRYTDGKLVQTENPLTSSAQSKSAFMKQWAIVSDFSEEGIACVSLGAEKSPYVDTLMYATGPYGFITRDETLLVEPVYDDAKSFSCGLAAVCKDGLWGYLSTDGQVAIALQYTAMTSFDQGCAFVQQNDSWSLIDTAGGILYQGFSPVGGYSFNLEFENGLAVVDVKGTLQIITPEGMRVF